MGVFYCYAPPSFIYIRGSCLMNLELRREGIMALSAIVHRMGLAGIDSREKFRAWAKEEQTFLIHAFHYPIAPGMPPIHTLFTADFHPELPLVMFNYSSTAHNTLHAHPEGWTLALRMCRGIVFELVTGRLVAHPFPKFFNLNEHPETMLETILQKLAHFHGGAIYGWNATKKMDGHLGIIFEYKGSLLFTTRGTFGSPSAKLGTTMLRRYEERCGWKHVFNPNQTILVELIDPATKVHVNYDGQSEFVLLGAYNRETLEDIILGSITTMPSPEEFLWEIAKRLKLSAQTNGPLFSKLADPIGDLTKLIASMKDRTVTNEEGFVIHLFDGTRFKIKYEAYIGLMVRAKLKGPTYMMNRIMAGNLDRMLLTLSEEVVPAANEQLGRILRVQFSRADLKERREYLYGLVPPELSTTYYRGKCREFLKFLDAGWQKPAEPNDSAEE